MYILKLKQYMNNLTSDINTEKLFGMWFWDFY